MSHDVLNDLLADVSRYVTADASAAWRAGTARRRRRYAGEGLALVAAVALVGLGFARLHDHVPVQPIDKTVVNGYPREVPRPFFEPDLPARPGPVAGAFGGGGVWHVVDAKGRSWQLKGAGEYAPSISDDGVLLAMMRADGSGAGHLEVRNLVTGSVQSYSDVGEGATYDAVPVTEQPYQTSMQATGFWSPDGTRLLLIGGRVSATHDAALVLDRGVVRSLRARGLPVGWASPSMVAWYDQKNRTVSLTDIDGRLMRAVRLQADLGGFPGQWGVRVSPDGSQLAVVDKPDGTYLLRVFSLETGRELRRVFPDPTVETPGPVVWHGDDVLIWNGSDLVDPWSGTTAVSLDDRWGLRPFLVWSPHSLTGPAHDGPSPLDARYWPLWWWWKAILIVLCVVLAGLGLWLLDRWNRRKRLRAT